ncbi:MAG: DUF3172 domain-containing protein [Cyanobacteria bacterium J083]|nr:MAG: DUF3172 domain-containing protein [Cyanobacteria bacterium J083]
MKRRNRDRYNNYNEPDYDSYAPTSRNGSSQAGIKGWLNYSSLAIIASVFILGVVVGIALNFSTNSNPASIDSRLEIDQQAPNPELCQQFGASAIVTDMRVFLTLNPFNVFVTQPVMQPGCVLRQNNWSLLERQKLVTSKAVTDCKRRMNTFGFTGVLEGSPKIDCVYQNDAAGNLFLNRPGSSGAKPESDNF